MSTTKTIRILEIPFNKNLEITIRISLLGTELYCYCRCEMISEFPFLSICFSDPKEIVRPRISLADCVEAFSKDETVDDFFSTAINAKSVAKK